MSASSSGRVHSFSQSSKCEMPGVYKINLEKSEKLIEALQKMNPIVAACFKLLTTSLLRDSCYNSCQNTVDEKKRELESTIKKCQNGENGGTSEVLSVLQPFYESIILQLENVRDRSFTEKQAKLVIDNGYDVIAIKQLVHHILGIQSCGSSDPQFVTLLNEDKQRFHRVMKDTGFLDSEFPIDYRPGRIICTILEENPNVDTLIFGCGTDVLTNSSLTCNNPEHEGWKVCALKEDKIKMQNEHHDGAITIDLSTSIDPDVIANMYDLQMLKDIPSDRIVLISDHSIGFLRLKNNDAEENNEEAFAEYFRILKPGGQIHIHGQLLPSCRSTLEKIGFTVDMERGYLHKPQL